MLNHTKYLPGDVNLAQMIRVNHSGELGAINIYLGQIKAARYFQSSLMPVLEHMYAQELIHYNYFKDIMISYNIRPSIFVPLWSKLGFIIGYLTYTCGPQIAMLLTVGIETAIEQHYKEQLNELRNITNLNCNKHSFVNDLYENILRFMQEEVEHLAIGENFNKNKKKCGYFGFSKSIKNITKIAIYIAKYL